MADKAHATAEATEQAASGGLPQLDFSTWPGQIFWLVITFGVLYIIFSRIVLPGLSSGIVAREDRIADDLDAAETMQQEAVEAEKAYTQSLADARAKAHNVAESTRQAIETEITAEIEDADAKAQAHSEAAEARIQKMREAALANIDSIATETASAMVKTLTGKTLTAATVRAAVKKG